VRVPQAIRLSWWNVGLVLALTCVQGSVFAQGRAVGLEERIEAIVRGIYRPGEPGAAVLVRRGGQILLRQGYGEANLEWNAQVTPETVFRLGSITKQFTAVCILKLAEQGKIALDDPVSRFLPEARGGETVEHLLTHTSGLGSLDRVPGYAAWSRAELKPGDLVALLAGGPRDFRPGEDWQYSDANYILLGALIEKVSGVPYQDFLRENVLLPLGMKSTYYDDGSQILRARAAGYSYAQGQVKNAPYLNLEAVSSAGALVSTVDDLARWDEALYGDRLVSWQLLARAFTPYRLRYGKPTFYGYGWVIHDFHGEAVFEHGGRINGFEAHLLRVPSQRIFICILTNVLGRDPGPDFVATRILEEVLGAGREEITDVPVARLREYQGLYRFSSELDYRVLLVGNRLVLRKDSSEERELVAAGTDHFRFQTSYSQVIFRRGAGGKIVGMTVQTKYGQEVSGERIDSP
jgi:CubicO group peptidase (beta-lactamase class C family)